VRLPWLLAALIGIAFPAMMLWESIGFYRAFRQSSIMREAPELDRLLEALGKQRGVLANAARMEDRWVRYTLSLDLLITGFAVWVALGLRSKRQGALLRAKQFAIGVAIYALIRQVIIPAIFSVEVGGGRTRLVLLLMAAAGTYVSLSRSERVKSEYPAG
jgi:hypothetical protein